MSAPHAALPWIATSSIAASLLAIAAAGCGGAAPRVERPSAPPLRVTVEEVGPEPTEASAREASIRENVSVRVSAEHQSLPPPVREGEPDPERWPEIVILNDTPHGIVVWVSGPCARTLALPAHAQNAAELCEGEYQLAAQLAASNFLPLVGEDATFDNGFRYTFTFYVREDPRRRRARRRR